MKFPSLDVRRQKRWKVLLLLGALLISIFFLFFTNYLVRELSEKESLVVKRIAHAFEQLNNPLIENYTEILEVIQSASIPIIVLDEKERIINIKNLDSLKVKDSTYLKNQLWWMNFYNDPIPIQVSENTF